MQGVLAHGCMQMYSWLSVLSQWGRLGFSMLRLLIKLLISLTFIDKVSTPSNKKCLA